MPHSVTDDAPPSSPPLAVIDPDDAQETEDNAGANQVDEDMDQDMTRADPGVEGEAVTEPEIKAEVKLEDLFDDMSEDEEFPASSAQQIKQSSSPEESPAPV